MGVMVRRLRLGVVESVQSRDARDLCLEAGWRILGRAKGWDIGVQREVAALRGLNVAFVFVEF